MHGAVRALLGRDAAALHDKPALWSALVAAAGEALQQLDGQGLLGSVPTASACSS